MYLVGWIHLDQVPGIRSAAKELFEWKDVIFNEEDWDSPAKIKLLNQEDAKYNGISFDELLERINEIE